MNKKLLSGTTTLLFLGVSMLQAHNWSYEPRPATQKIAATPATNRVTALLLPPSPPGFETVVNARRIADASLERIFSERADYAVRSRLNPAKSLDYLFFETVDEPYFARYAKDGRSATIRGLRLTGRLYAAKQLHIGGFLGEVIGGRRIGSSRPSPFRAEEGLYGWNPPARNGHTVKDFDFLRTSPYLNLGYRQSDWLGRPSWEIWNRVNARLDTSDWRWDRPRFESGGALYLTPRFALESGVQLLNGSDRRDGQKFAVFLGSSFETRCGTVRFGVSGTHTEAIRASLLYWLYW